MHSQAGAWEREQNALFPAKAGIQLGLVGTLTQEINACLLELETENKQVTICDLLKTLGAF